MVKRYIPPILIALGLWASLPIFGQDIHHSQFYTSPLNVNPALTGIFNGDLRFAANYKNQWFRDDLVDYLTFTASVDKRFYPKKWTSKGMWGAGFLLNYDRAGDSKLSLAHIGLSACYAYPLTTNNIISIGALVGGSQRRFQEEDLVWETQWTGNGFDPNFNPGENFGKTSRTFFDLSAGFNYRWQKSMRTKLDLGVGVFHLNQPEQKFFENSPSSKLPMRININATPSLRIVDRFDLLLHGQVQLQNPYQEIVVGAYGKIYISQQRGKEFALLLGVATRLEDAWIPKVAFEYNNWYAGISYDINTSDYKIATNRNGGPEISLLYTFVKSRPLPQLKTCPIF
ncbi:MAG: PorP/SprF family type IX secretion system membrane protein [Bacteroidota bacterium]|nr:PorP/SprF family type IX secretion system membrane protein [Bacteroidota bacterium]